MPRKSAGLLVYRKKSDILEVLLIHMGGPYWENKDEGAWSIPKGEFTQDEEPLDAAIREFREEMGSSIEGDYIPLQPVKQPGGKIVYAFALAGDFDVTTLKSNSYFLEWPPKSGHRKAYPEVDRASWFSTEEALHKILKGQRGLSAAPNVCCLGSSSPFAPPRLSMRFREKSLIICNEESRND